MKIQHNSAELEGLSGFFNMFLSAFPFFVSITSSDSSCDDGKETRIHENYKPSEIIRASNMLSCEPTMTKSVGVRARMKCNLTFVHILSRETFQSRLACWKSQISVSYENDVSNVNGAFQHLTVQDLANHL
jgi:hypothetical protein